MTATTKRRFKFTAAALIAAAGISLVGATGPAHAATPDVCPPQVTNSKGALAATGGIMDLVEMFAKSAGSAAGGKGFNFIMSQLGLGDTSAAQMTKISDQLDKMDAKLNVLQNSVDDLAKTVNRSDFTNLMLSFKDLRANVENINSQGFQPVALAAANLAQVQADRDAARASDKDLQEARACLAQQKSNFISVADQLHAVTNVDMIANRLNSSSGEGQLIDAYGKMLAQKNPMLTSAQSEQLRAFYDYLEQYQALAAIQKAEWQIAKGLPTSVVAASNKKFLNTTAAPGESRGYIGDQRASLPTEIPTGVVIALRPAAAGTQGQTMFMTVAPDNAHPDAAFTWRDPDKFHPAAADTTTEVNTINTNADVGRGLTGWRMWTAAEWSTLTTPSAGKTPAETLNTTFGLAGTGSSPTAKPFTAGQFLWVADGTKSNAVKTGYGRHTHETLFTSHRAAALSAAGASWTFAPGLPGHDDNLFPHVAAAFDAAKGRMVVARTVDVNYLGTK